MNLTQPTKPGRPVKKKHKTKFNKKTAHVKCACKELEMFRILNFELKYEINSTY